MGISNIWASHKRLILAIVCAIAVVVVATLGYVMIYAQPKQVQFVVDGVAQTYETKAKTVEQFLYEQNITVKDKDVLTPAMDTKITDQLTIDLKVSWEVPVAVDGQTKIVHTIHRDVAEILAEGGIELREQDKVQPELTAKISQPTTIVVTRIDQQIVTVEETVPFQEIRKSDSSLLKGQTRILQKGEEGKVALHYQVLLENGEEVSRELIEKEIITPQKNQIVAVGTRPNIETATALVSRGGKPERYEKVLTGVTLSAYAPGDGGIGPDHPWYGKTASGTKTVVGQTIAVDPNVIPLGWWVYIEGIGYRRAEDTGGAIKGNKIDVFVGSRSEALKFGLKRNRTVYVIGPNKPE